MPNPPHLAKLEEGVEAWNQWRRENPDIRPHLRKADLSRTDLSGAQLGGAHLGEVNLFSANLSGACLRGANLIGANLSEADLSGADLTGAWAANALFVNLDLRGVKGLDAVIHSGPSTVGIDTIYKSDGRIPPSFLRGCGVPDALITYIPSLVAAQTGIQYRSLFISYSIEDHQFAERLSADLEANGFRCWFAPHNDCDDEWMKEQSDQAIQVEDRWLLILSENNLECPWVKEEIERAYQRGLKEDRRVLYPVSVCPIEKLAQWEEIDPDTCSLAARELRECFIPNFSNWHDRFTFKQVFREFLREMQGKQSLFHSFAALEPQLQMAVA